MLYTLRSESRCYVSSLHISVYNTNHEKSILRHFVFNIKHHVNEKCILECNCKPQPKNNIGPKISLRIQKAPFKGVCIEF